MVILQTLYGQFVYPEGFDPKHLHFLALKSLTKFFATIGYSPGTVRLMLSRSVKDGEFLRKKNGKNVFYSPSPEMVNDIYSTGAWAFSKDSQKPWDGGWFIVTYQIPDERRELRERLRNRLTRLGFGRLTYSVWVSPFDRSEVITRIANELQISNEVITFSSKETNMPPETLTTRAWDLSKIARYYLDLIELLNTIKAALSNNPSDEEAFGGIWEACAHFVITVKDDPYLPPALLPADWPGNRAAELYSDLVQILYTRALNFYKENVVYF